MIPMPDRYSLFWSNLTTTENPETTKNGITTSTIQSTASNEMFRKNWKTLRNSTEGPTTAALPTGTQTTDMIDIFEDYYNHDFFDYNLSTVQPDLQSQAKTESDIYDGSVEFTVPNVVMRDVVRARVRQTIVFYSYFLEKI